MPDQILDSIDRKAEVIFYPSSCGYSDDFQAVPFDVVILNSEASRQSKKTGKVYRLNFDNNELLGLFAAKRIRLSAMVVIRDGCEEGGNYECVATDNFFGRLMPVMADRFDYFYDHGPDNGRPSIDVPAAFAEFESPAYLEPFIRNSEPLGDVRAFHVTPFAVVERDFFLGQIRVRVIRDSIWRSVGETDLMIVKQAIPSVTKSSANRPAILNYLKGLRSNTDLNQKFEFMRRSPLTCFQHLLDKAADQNLSRLCFMPIANGKYQQIALTIQKWKKEYPREIDFYHLNAGDFELFRSIGCEWA
jgi:hypothetical protein